MNKFNEAILSSIVNDAHCGMCSTADYLAGFFNSSLQKNSVKKAIQKLVKDEMIYCVAMHDEETGKPKGRGYTSTEKGRDFCSALDYEVSALDEIP